MATQLHAGAIQQVSRLALSADQPNAPQHRLPDPETPEAQSSFAGTAIDESVLGDYRLDREIGRGGMGIVYEATQLSLRRRVALKILPFAAVLDKQQVARFRNEAQAAASLHHPHIVPVFAVGCERGVHYYSMQLIDGRTLDHVFTELSPKKLRRSPGDVQANNDEQQIAAANFVSANVVSGLAEQTTLEAPKVPLASPVPLRSTAPDEVSLDAPSSRFGNNSTQAQKLGQATTVQSVRSRSYVHNTVELLISVAEALDFAHRQGVVHRDIKPSNLLVDSSGKIWVADFGLARVRGVGNLTAAGSVLGTARYMSPEQIKGQPQEIDHRTDIYSLGITLYELLTLQPAFKAASRALLFKAIESDDPVPPRRLNSTVAVDLETIVLKAIAKCRSDRYATAGEMAADMRRFLEGKPTLARRPTPLDRAFKWAIRRQRLVLSSICILILAVIALAVATVMVTRESRLKDHATTQARDYLDQAHMLVDRFGGLMNRRLAAIEGTAELRSELLREAELYYVGFLEHASENIVLRGELPKVQYRLAATYREQGDLDSSEQKYRQAIAGFEALQDQTQWRWHRQADLALCWHNLAALEQQRGNYAEASTAYRLAIELQDSLLQLTESAPRVLQEWAMTRNLYGLLLWHYDDSQQAVQMLNDTRSRLLEYLKKAPQDRVARQQLVECRNSLVACLMHEDPDRAESLLNDNIADLDVLAAPDDSLPHVLTTAEFLVTEQSVACQLAVCRNNLATVLGRKGQRERALSIVRKAIAVLEPWVIQRPTDADAQEQLAVANNNLGQLLWLEAADREAAMEAFKVAEKSLRSRTQSGDGSSESLSRLAGVLHNLGMVHHTQGLNPTAIDYLTEAMDLQSQAVNQVPFHKGYRRYLEEHKELLDQILTQFKASRPPVPGASVRCRKWNVKQNNFDRNVV